MIIDKTCNSCANGLMLYSISALARFADIPRRTAQYWVDFDVLEPVPDDERPGQRDVFSLRELEIARLLRPFQAMKSPLQVLQLLAVVFRHILDEEMHSDEDMEAYGRAIRAARAGKPAVLTIQLYFRDDGTLATTTFPGVGKNIRLEITDHLMKQLAMGRPMVTVSLTDALHLPEVPQVAASRPAPGIASVGESRKR